MELWKEKVKDKPYVPANLTDLPENLETVDLAIRIESVLSQYYETEKESAQDIEEARTRHFAEISQQVYSGDNIELFKPLPSRNEIEPQEFEQLESADNYLENEEM